MNMIEYWTKAIRLVADDIKPLQFEMMTAPDGLRNIDRDQLSILLTQQDMYVRRLEEAVANTKFVKKRKLFRR